MLQCRKIVGLIPASALFCDVGFCTDKWSLKQNEAACAAASPFELRSGYLDGLPFLNFDFRQNDLENAFSQSSFGFLDIDFNRQQNSAEQ